tara:strand:+ start:2378 stop:6025 length:3648 start_codon:yes stop_codon:yes gene_type:complete
VTPAERAARQRRANGGGLLDWGRGVVDAGANAVSNDQYALTPEQQNRANGEQLRANIVGGAEVGLAGAGGVVSLLPQGINTLVGLPLAGVDNTIKTNERIADFFTRTPTTEAGIDIGRGLAETMQPVAEMDASARDWLGNKATIEGLPTEVNGLLYGAGTIVPEIFASMFGIGAMARAFNSASIAPHLKPGFKYEGGVVAGRKAKKLNPDAVALADSMKAGGSSAAEIREATKALGTPIWFDTDGSLRWEIDDSGMKVKRDATGYTLADKIEHPELFDNYPELKDVRMNDDFNLGATGAYDESRNTISYNSEQPAFDTKKLLAHEGNHAVQGIEGFARGGSPSEFKAYPQSFISEFQTNQMPRLVELEGKASLTNLEGHELRKLSRVRDNIVEYAEKSQGGRLSPFEMYKRKLGEADSRAVEDRIGMTKQQRDEVEFNESHDVPAEEITRDYFGGQPSLSDKEKRNGDPIPDKGLLGINTEKGSDSLPDSYWENLELPLGQQKKNKVGNYDKIIGGGAKMRIPIHEMESTWTQRPQYRELPEISPSDLHGSMVQSANMDISTGQKTIHSVNGVPLETPVNTYGGRDHIANDNSIPSVWAAGDVAAQKMTRAANIAIDNGVRPVIATSTMNPGALDFNTPMAETTFGLMKQSMIPGDIDIVDEMIRKQRPEWVGVNHPEAFEMLENNGEVRKALVEAAGSARVQDMDGSPDMPSVRHAITAEDMRSGNLGEIGHGFGILDGTLMPNTLDNTYPTAMGGGPLGKFQNTNVHRNDLFASWFGDRRTRGKAQKDDPYSFERSKPSQIIDNQQVDKMTSLLGLPHEKTRGMADWRITQEQTNAADKGEFGSWNEQPFEVKRVRDEAVPWGNIVTNALGRDGQKSLSGIGSFAAKGEDGEMMPAQSNYLEVIKDRVDMKPGPRKNISLADAERNRQEMIATIMGAVDMQDGVAANAQVRNPEGTSLQITPKKPLTIQQSQRLAEIAEDNAMMFVDNGDGNIGLLDRFTDIDSDEFSQSLLHSGGTPSQTKRYKSDYKERSKTKDTATKAQKNKARATARKSLTKDNSLLGQIDETLGKRSGTELSGLPLVNRMDWDGIYVDLSKDWAIEGKGAVTQRVLDSVNSGNRSDAEKLLGDTDFKKMVMDKLKRDNFYEGAYKNTDTPINRRADFDNLRQILADPDLSGKQVLEALEKGMLNLDKVPLASAGGLLFNSDERESYFG